MKVYSVPSSVLLDGVYLYWWKKEKPKLTTTAFIDLKFKGREKIFLKLCENFCHLPKPQFSQS